MTKKLIIWSLGIATALGIGVFSSFLAGETDASSKFKTYPDKHSQDLAIEYAFPIEHLDNNGDLVFVTLSGITQGTEVSDPIPDIVRAINDFGGLAASNNIIEYKDAEGNVFMRIPEELDSQSRAQTLHSKNVNPISHDKLMNMIKKHDEKVNEYKAAEGMRTLELYDNIEWPEAENRNTEEDHVTD